MQTRARKLRPRRTRSNRLAADAPRPVGHPAQRLQRALGNRALRGFASNEMAREREADSVGREVGGPKATAVDPIRAAGLHLGADFSDVAIERSPAISRGLEAAGAEAATDGTSVFLNERSLRSGTHRRAVVAHELTHVAQTRAGSRPSAAPKGAAQLKAKPGKPKGFMYGDVLVKDQHLRRAILGETLLLPKKDRAGLGFDKKQLGFDSNFTAGDRFRWDILRFVIDKGAVDLDQVGRNTKFKVEGPLGPEDQTLSWNATKRAEALGMFLPAASKVKSGLRNPGSRDRIVVSSQSFGSWPARASLAHEFLGHYYLYLKGVPFEHVPRVTQDTQGREIRRSARGTKRSVLEPKHGIKLPGGRIFQGETRAFMELFVDAETTGSGKTLRPVSPTADFAARTKDAHLELLRVIGMQKDPGIRKWTVATKNFARQLWAASDKERQRVFAEFFIKLFKMKEKQRFFDFVKDNLKDGLKAF